MVNAEYNSSQYMVNSLQNLKVKSTLKIYPSISNYHNEMKYRRQSGTFQSEEELFNKNEERITKLYFQVMLLLKVLLTEPQVKEIILILNFKKLLLKMEMITKM